MKRILNHELFTNKWFMLFVFSVAIRLVGSNQSLWHDEAATVIISSLPVGQILKAIEADFHPPLFYLLMSAWMKLGVTSEVFLRLPNILLGAASAYILGRMVFLSTGKESSGIFAFWLLAINPLHIYYSQELRMYSFATFLATCSWYLLLKKDKISSLLWVIVTTLGFYTFYGLWINWFVQILWLLLSKRLRLHHFSSLILVVPWLPTLSKQLGGGSFIQEMFPGWAVLSGKASIKSVLLIFLKFVTGRINLQGEKILTLISTLAVSYVLYIVYRSLRMATSRIYGWWMFINLLLALLISLFTPVLGYWRYITLLPAFVGLISIYVTDNKKNLIWGSGVSLIFGFCLVTFWMIPNYWREDWKAVGSYIGNFETSKTVLVTSFIGDLPALKWYLPEYRQFYTKKYLMGEEDAYDQALFLNTDGKRDYFVFDYLSDLSDPTRKNRSWFVESGFKLIGEYDFRGVGIVHHFRSPDETE